MKWKPYSLAELGAPVDAALATGPFGSAVSSVNFRDSGVPMLRGSNLRVDVGTRLDESDLVYLDTELALKFKRSTARRGDLIFTCWGTVGQIGLIDDSSKYESYIVSNKQMKLTPDPSKVSSLFLYYLLSQTSFVDVVQSQAIGSSVPGFNLGQLRALRVLLPPVEQQKAIAEVLGALDDKIAADKASIESAVKVAAELTRAGSPSHTTVGAIALLRLVSIHPAAFPSRKVWHYSLPAFDAGMRPIHELRDDIKSAKFLLEEPAVLVSKLNPRFPRVWNVMTMSVDSSVSSTEFIPLVPVGVSVSVLWACLLDPAFGAALESRVSGTSGSHQRVRPSDIQAAVIADPRTFASSVVGALDALGMHVELTRNGIDKLAALRDTLLPALMSGKLRVRDAVKAVEEVL